MKIRADLVVRKIGDENFIVEPNQGMVDLARVVKLNDTAAFLFEQLKGRNFEKGDVIQLLMEQFDVDVDQAERDVLIFLVQLRENRLIKENRR